MELPTSSAKNKTQKASGVKSVLTAVFGNLTVTILKLSGWMMTGSSVMLSESIHSFADTSNQFLLFIGIRRSERPADDEYQYGYRQERFFWALISACGIFFLGAGVTFFHGIEAIMHHEPTHVSSFTFPILFASLCLESFSLLTAYKEAKHASGNEPIVEYLKHSGDPTILAVIYEDSAAIAGILIAIVSIYLNRITGNPIWDGVGSILVSLLLCSVSIILMAANRNFLLNKSVPRHFKEKIKKALKEEELVDEVHDLKTVMIGVDGFIVKVEIEANGHYLAEKIFGDLDMKNEYEHIKKYNDFIKYSSELCDRTTRIMGREIDEIEARIIQKIPNIKHIDIETN